MKKYMDTIRRVESYLFLLKKLNVDPDSELIDQVTASTLEDSISLSEQFVFKEFSKKYNVRDLIEHVLNAAFSCKQNRTKCDTIKISKKNSSTSLQQKMSALFSQESGDTFESQCPYEECNITEIEISCDDVVQYMFTDSILDKYQLLYRLVSKCEFTIGIIDSQRHLFKSRKVCAILHRSSSLLTSFIFYLKNICLTRDLAHLLDSLSNVK